MPKTADRFDDAVALATPRAQQEAERPVSPQEQAGYRMCARCIMDTTDPDIAFDEKECCNHCRGYDEISQARLFPSEVERQRRLEKLVRRIKQDGRGKDYDCVIGVSGGVDSTYVAYLVKQLGLRPLAVHLDNGWDSELAVSNIESVLKKLDIDLYTHVIDWEEFRDLQLAFLKASTPDGEVPTDHAIIAVLYQLAVRHGLRYVIMGTNVISESIMPVKWGYGYSDFRYIRDVHRRFGHRKLATFPHFNLATLFYYNVVRRIRLISILNYVRYDKSAAMETLQKQLNWVYYGGKHYESIYTRFFQAYILPRKFTIDKRKAHYSNLICSGQLSRSQALEMMQADVFPADQLASDQEYVIKKFGITECEFEELMSSPRKTFLDYGTNYHLLHRIKRVQILKSLLSAKR